MLADVSSHAAEEAAIRSVLSAYEEALNASNTEAVMPLYTDDGVFMPPNNPSAVGKAPVRQSYEAVFKAITLNVSSPLWSLSRCRRNGLSCAPIPPAPTKSLRAMARSLSAATTPSTPTEGPSSLHRHQGELN